MSANTERAPRAASVLLTVGTLAFFGPIARDFNPSHLLNPTWVGHARVHVMWLMCFSLYSGIANLYLVWARKSRDAHLVALAWQSAGALGFWTAGLAAPLYGGVTSVEGTHVHVLGIEESTAFFAVITAVIVAAAVSLARPARGESKATAPSA